MSRNKPVRMELGGMERIAAFLHDEFHGALIPAGMARIRGGVLRPEPLRLALRALQDRHPRLRSRLCRQGKSRYFFEELESPPGIPLDFLELGEDREYWRYALQQLNKTPFDTEKGPFMRVRVLLHPGGEVCDLLMAWHHAIVDGPAVFQIVHDLMNYYEKADKGESLKVDSREFSSGALPDIRLSFFERIRFLWNSIRFAKGPAWNLRFESTELCPRRLVFSEEELKGILDRCRKREVSLSGFLSAVAITVLGEMSREGYGEGCGRITFGTPVDLRSRREGVTMADVGCHISSFNRKYPRPGSREGLWKRAQELTSDLAEYALSDDPLRLVKFTEEWVHRVRRAPRRTTFVINNLGVYHFAPSYGPLRIEEYAWSANADQFGSDLALLAVTIHGRLNFQVGGIYLGSRTMDRFLSGFREILQQQTGAEGTPA